MDESEFFILCKDVLLIALKISVPSHREAADTSWWNKVQFLVIIFDKKSQISIAFITEVIKLKLPSFNKINFQGIIYKLPIWRVKDLWNCRTRRSKSFCI